MKWCYIDIYVCTFPGFVNVQITRYPIASKKEINLKYKPHTLKQVTNFIARKV